MAKVSLFILAVIAPVSEVVLFGQGCYLRREKKTAFQNSLISISRVPDPGFIVSTPRAVFLGLRAFSTPVLVYANRDLLGFRAREENC